MIISIESMHFLVAGCDREYLIGMGKALRSMNAGLLTPAISGRDAIYKWTSATRVVDCAICELNMPDGNGLQLLQAVRTGVLRGVRPDTCYILVTDKADPNIVSVAARLDVNGLLVKPVTPERLLSAIQKGRSRSVKVDYNAYNRVEVPV